MKKSPKSLPAPDLKKVPKKSTNPKNNTFLRLFGDFFKTFLRLRAGRPGDFFAVFGPEGLETAVDGRRRRNPMSSFVKPPLHARLANAENLIGAPTVLGNSCSFRRDLGGAYDVHGTLGGVCETWGRLWMDRTSFKMRHGNVDKFRRILWILKDALAQFKSRYAQTFRSQWRLLGWYFGRVLDSFYGGFLQRDASMRALWSDTQNRSHNMSQKIAQRTRPY